MSTRANYFFLAMAFLFSAVLPADPATHAGPSNGKRPTESTVQIFPKDQVKGVWEGTWTDPADSRKKSVFLVLGQHASGELHGRLEITNDTIETVPVRGIVQPDGSIILVRLLDDKSEIDPLKERIGLKVSADGKTLSGADYLWGKPRDNSRYFLQRLDKSKAPFIISPTNGQNWKVDDQQQDIAAFDVRVADENYDDVITTFKWVDKPHPMVHCQNSKGAPARCHIVRHHNYLSFSHYQVFPLIITAERTYRRHGVGSPITESRSIVVNFTMGNKPSPPTRR